jgi:shikimate kinase
MLNRQNVYLIGPMGAGKTAVGRRLATLLGMRFVDSDAEIEKATGVDIGYIFEREGEPRFRERERDVIAGLTALVNVVVATGGGAVLDPTTRERLTSTGTVIYLKTDVDAQLRRTRQTRTRPLLRNEDPRTVLERLMVIRRPLYEGMADLSIETTNQQVRSVADKLRAMLAERERAVPPGNAGTSA